MTNEQKHFGIELVHEEIEQMSNGLITESEAWDKVSDVIVQVHYNTSTKLVDNIDADI